MQVHVHPMVQLHRREEEGDKDSTVLVSLGRKGERTGGHLPQRDKIHTWISLSSVVRVHARVLRVRWRRFS